MSPYKPNGRPAAEIQAGYDAMPMVARCAFCPTWAFDGTVAECRAASASHRAQYHRDTKVTRRRRRGSLKRFIDPDPSYRAGGLAAAAEVARMHARRDAA